MGWHRGAARKRIFRQLGVRSPVRNNSWIYRRGARSASVRLFCFPYAGGTAAGYRDWQAEFADQVEICAIEPPGRRHRLSEEPLRRLTDLADAVVDGLAGELDLPF